MILPTGLIYALSMVTCSVESLLPSVDIVFIHIAELSNT